MGLFNFQNQNLFFELHKNVGSTIKQIMLFPVFVAADTFLQTEIILKLYLQII